MVNFVAIGEFRLGIMKFPCFSERLMLRRCSFFDHPMAFNVWLASIFFGGSEGSHFNPKERIKKKSWLDKDGVIHLRKETWNLKIAPKGKPATSSPKNYQVWDCCR